MDYCSFCGTRYCVCGKILTHLLQCCQHCVGPTLLGLLIPKFDLFILITKIMKPDHKLRLDGLLTTCVILKAETCLIL